MQGTEVSLHLALAGRHLGRLSPATAPPSPRIPGAGDCSPHWTLGRAGRLWDSFHPGLDGNPEKPAPEGPRVGTRKSFLVTKTIRHGWSSFRRYRGGRSMFTSSKAHSCPDSHQQFWKIPQKLQSPRWCQN